MMSLEEIRAVNEQAARDMRKRLQAELPELSTNTADKMIPAIARLAMNRLDTWLAEADRALVGRMIVRTRGPLTGAVCTIRAVSVAVGASGYHLFIVAPVRASVRDTWSQSRSELWEADRALLELDVNCELLKETDE